MPEKLVAEASLQSLFQFPQIPKKKTFKTFFYDKENGEIMGRTTRSWGLLLVFYFFYFVVLFSLCFICFQALLYTLNDIYPKWQLEQSIIGTSPGMGFRPMPDDMKHAALLEYNASDKVQVQGWVDRINAFLESYQTRSLLPNNGENQVICDFRRLPGYRQVCAFDLTKLGPCSAENAFNYHKSAPCIIIKLNRIYGWLPQPYSNVNELPNDMPADLVEHIKSQPEDERHQVWVSCNSVGSATDIEALGPVEYFPNRGFPSYYYPYLNVPGYLSPLIAVQFTRPTVNRDIKIECRAWAKNINYHGGYRFRQGSFALTLHIE